MVGAWTNRIKGCSLTTTTKRWHFLSSKEVTLDNRESSSFAVRLDLILGFLLSSNETSGPSLNLSEPRFPHLWNGNNNSTHPRVLSWWLSDMMRRAQRLLGPHQMLLIDVTMSYLGLGSVTWPGITTRGGEEGKEQTADVIDKHRGLSWRPGFLF